MTPSKNTYMVLTVNFLSYTERDVGAIVSDYLLWALLGYEAEDDFDSDAWHELCWKTAFGQTHFVTYGDEIMVDYDTGDKFLYLSRESKDLIDWIKNEYAGMFLDVFSSCNITDISLGYVDNYKATFLIEYSL